MESLLNGGAQIVSGYFRQFTLHQEDKWILCDVHIGETPGQVPNSTCYALN
jgi:hypothetical protein